MQRMVYISPNPVGIYKELTLLLLYKASTQDLPGTQEVGRATTRYIGV